MSNCLNCNTGLAGDVLCCPSCYAFQRWQPEHVRHSLYQSDVWRSQLSRCESEKECSDDLRSALQMLIEKTEPDHVKASYLFVSIFDHYWGFGPLGFAMRDPSLRTLIVKDFDRIFASNSCGEIRTGIAYLNREHLLLELNKLINLAKQPTLDEAENTCEFLLANWNCRINRNPKADESFLVLTVSAV